MGGAGNGTAHKLTPRDQVAGESAVPQENISPLLTQSEHLSEPR